MPATYENMQRVLLSQPMQDLLRNFSNGICRIPFFFIIILTGLNIPDRLEVVDDPELV